MTTLTLTFDPFKYAADLEAVGVPGNQAKVRAEVKTGSALVRLEAKMDAALCGVKDSHHLAVNSVVMSPHTGKE